MLPFILHGRWVPHSFDSHHCCPRTAPEKSHWTRWFKFSHLLSSRDSSKANTLWRSTSLAHLCESMPALCKLCSHGELLNHSGLCCSLSTRGRQWLIQAYGKWGNTHQAHSMAWTLWAVGIIANDPWINHLLSTPMPMSLRLMRVFVLSFSLISYPDFSLANCQTLICNQYKRTWGSGCRTYLSAAFLSRSITVGS